MSQLNWKISSRCAQGGCVSVAATDDAVHVRDSKLGAASPQLRFTHAEWRLLVVDEIRDGGWLPEYSYREDDETVVWLRRPGATPRLLFGPAEWDTFIEAVRAGEFDVDVLAAVKSGDLDVPL